MFKKVVESERVELRSKSIQYLRSIADAIGVDSPTLMDKEELIDEILVVLMGGNAGKKKETRGRPKKNGKRAVFSNEPESGEVVVEYDTVIPKGLGVGLFTSNDYKGNDKPIGSEYEEFINYYQNRIIERECVFGVAGKALSKLSMTIDKVKEIATIDMDYLIADNDYEILYGYIVCKDNRYYVLENAFNFSRKLDITEEIEQNNYDIRSGDEIHFYLNGENARILLCNKQDVAEMNKRPCFEKLEVEYPNKMLKSINLMDKLAPIAYGSRNLLCGEVKNARYILGKALRKISKNKDIYIYAIGIDMKKEDLSILKTTTDVVLNLSLINDLRDEEKRVSLFCERIKRLAELGNDILVYVNDVEKLKKLGDVVRLGASFKNQGSITTIATSSTDKIQGIENKFTNIVCIEKCGEEKQFVCVNAKKSTTLFVDGFLSRDESLALANSKENFESFSTSDLESLINNYE